MKPSITLHNQRPAVRLRSYARAATTALSTTALLLGSTSMPVQAAVSRTLYAEYNYPSHRSDNWEVKGWATFVDKGDTYEVKGRAYGYCRWVDGRAPWKGFEYRSNKEGWRRNQWTCAPNVADSNYTDYFTGKGPLGPDKEVCIRAGGWGGFIPSWGWGQQVCTVLK